MVIRQGDVLLVKVLTIPKGAIAQPAIGGRIVLAFGEVTGHAHAIYDWQAEGKAGEIAEAAIARARLFVAPSGERFLKVTAPVTLRHEEHTAHTLAPGIYRLPAQVEYSPAELRAVAD